MIWCLLNPSVLASVFGMDLQFFTCRGGSFRLFSCDQFQGYCNVSASYVKKSELCVDLLIYFIPQVLMPFEATEIYIMFHKIYIVLGLLYPAALVLFFILLWKESCADAVWSVIFVSRSLLQFMCKNDICHEIFSCVIAFETVSQLWSIAVHSYICVAPFQPVLDTKPREKLFLLSCWHVLKLRERPFARLSQQMNPGFIILNCRQKGTLWNGTILYLPRRKNWKNLHMQARSWSLSSGIVKGDSCGYDADRGDRVLLHLWRGAERTQEAFQISLAWQESSRNVASAWQGKAKHKFEDSESHQNLGGQCYCIHPTAPIWYLQITTYFKSSRMLCAVWSFRLMSMWFLQGELGYVSRTRHTHTYSWLVQGCRSGWRLCGNIEYGV